MRSRRQRGLAVDARQQQLRFWRVGATVEQRVVSVVAALLDTAAAAAGRGRPIAAIGTDAYLQLLGPDEHDAGDGTIGRAVAGEERVRGWLGLDA
jgi:hypothetical protein